MHAPARARTDSSQAPRQAGKLRQLQLQSEIRYHKAQGISQRQAGNQEEPRWSSAAFFSSLRQFALGFYRLQHLLVRLNLGTTLLSLFSCARICWPYVILFLAQQPHHCASSTSSLALALPLSISASFFRLNSSVRNLQSKQSQNLPSSTNEMQSKCLQNTLATHLIPRHDSPSLSLPPSLLLSLPPSLLLLIANLWILCVFFALCSLIYLHWPMPHPIRGSCTEQGAQQWGDRGAWHCAGRWVHIKCICVFFMCLVVVFLFCDFFCLFVAGDAPQPR